MAISIPGDKLVVNHICSSMSIWVFIAQSASKFPLPQSNDVTDPTVVLTTYPRHLPEKYHPLQYETVRFATSSPHTPPLPEEKWILKTLKHNKMQVKILWCIPLCQVQGFRYKCPVSTSEGF